MLTTPTPAPRFGKILVTSANTYATRSEMNIFLSGWDRRRHPIPYAQDGFSLTLKDGEFQVREHGSGAAFPLSRQAVRPLLARMTKKASPVEWQRLLDSQGDISQALRAVFRGVTLENQNGDRFFQDFAHTLHAMARVAGLIPPERRA